MRTSIKSVLLAAMVFAFSAAAPRAEQKTFPTPKAATNALLEAASEFNVPELLEILGPDGKDLVASQDPVQDKSRAADFVAKAKEKEAITVDPKHPDHATIVVGNQDWPFPIPIVKAKGTWRFDTPAGQGEILKRRIGTNELDTITVCRGYVEAQKEYASEVHDNSGLKQYAQRIISSPGKHDGLAWKNEDGSWGGPVGHVVADAIENGYSKRGEPFHGYYFKVLKGQGPGAPLGQLDYQIQGAMIGGFALVAWPAQYGVTGVQTFIVSYNGIVYQKDLGPNSTTIASAIERYNPNQSWRRTDDDWAPA